ncbi:MAG: hypothetical protein AAB426_06750, partial [Myxococcota bacterium]
MSTAPTHTSALPRHPVTQFWRGLGYPLRALAFVRRHGLWGAVTLPFLVNLVLLGVLVYGTWVFVGPWLTSVSNSLEGLA